MFHLSGSKRRMFRRWLTRMATAIRRG